MDYSGGEIRLLKFEDDFPEMEIDSDLGKMAEMGICRANL
jgi:hypothetical protein